MGKRTATATRTVEIDTARRSVTIPLVIERDGVAYGVDVLAVKRTRPDAGTEEGAKVDGRMWARYDSHSRVYGAESVLVGDFHAIMATAGVDSPEGKAARARAQYHGPRRLADVLRRTRDAATLDGRQDAVLIERRAQWSVDAGGRGVGAYVLAGTVRVDGEPCDLHVSLAADEAWVGGEDWITVGA